MADDKLIDFEFSKGVVEYLNTDPDKWIDVIPWDFKTKGWEETTDNWIDILPWDFKVNGDGEVLLKDQVVAEVQTDETDEVWLAGLLGTLVDDGYF